MIWGNHSLFGQSTPQTNVIQSDKKQTVSFSYSPVSTYIISLKQSFEKFEVVLGEFGVRGVGYKPYLVSGIFTVGYRHAIKERLTVTLNLSYQQIGRKWDLYVDAYSPYYYTERFHFFQVVPEVRYDYVKREHIALFLSAGIGVNYFYNIKSIYSDIIEPYTKTDLGFQIWALGFEITPVNNLVVNIKPVGIGTIGFFEIGLGYRF